MRIAITAAVLLISLTVTAVVVFVALFLLTGPHTGHLPDPLAPLAIAAGAVTLLTVPALAARATWRRLAPASSLQPPEARSSAG